jgi:type I restriction enzyme R subunit
METPSEKIRISERTVSALMDELLRRLMEATNVAIFFNSNKNITFEGETIRLFNVSGTELSEDDEFKKNIFSAVEEVPYIFKYNGETQFSIRPDISFFVNGIFFGYAELKSNFHNQNARENGRKKVVYDYLEASRAYTALAQDNDVKQSLRRRMLRIFEKSIHITSTDIYKTYVIRDLARYYDDFRKGFTDKTLSMADAAEEVMKSFKPYPVTDEDAPMRIRFEEVMRALYDKIEIQKEILYYNFIEYEYVKNKKSKERRSNRGRLIAPRPKQKFGCDKILKRIDEFLEHEKQPDYFLKKLRRELEKMNASPDFIEKVIAERDSYSNNKYVYSLLMQYAAGFGKSNIIGWTALQLKDLRKDKKWVFDKILIVVDRLQLRDQLDDMMQSMNIDRAMFIEAVDKKTFIKALSDNRRIIVVNIQKFLDLQQAITESGTQLKNMRVAFLIDEIHRSNTGENHDEMISLFEQLQDVFDTEGKKSPRKEKKNLIIGLTATPSQNVLARFGEYHRGSNLNQLWKPFDAYTMREAIQDGYILDPTEHIIPVPAKMYYEIPNLNLCYASGDDAERRYGVRKEKIYADKDRIQAISKFVVNRLLSLVYGKIRGTGKAMLAVSSIPIAIEYVKAIRKIMEEKMATGKYEGYRNAPISIVYSDRQDVQSSRSLNDNQSEEAVIKNFKLAKNGLLIVVDKLQTGFDEPHLHTLFLDKEIRDINAIQTISRVNRTCKYKEDCHIIDLSHNNVNVDNIRDAFATYCDMVISNLEPMTQKAIIERDYKTLIAEMLFKKCFDTYQGSINSVGGNTYLILDMEDDFRRWIIDTLKRKQDEKDRQQAEENTNGVTDTDDDALKLKKLINEYLRTLPLINGIIEIDKKFTDKDFIDFWQRYIYVYNSLLGKDRTETIAINVIYDNELGLVVAPEENGDEEANEDGHDKDKRKKLSKRKKDDPDLMAIIQKLNEVEEQKGDIIQEWKEYVDEMFTFLKEDTKLIAKINTPDHFTREELYIEFRKSMRKFLRKNNDPIKRKFFEENLELLMEDFENSLIAKPESTVYELDSVIQLPSAAEPLSEFATPEETTSGQPISQPDE